LFSFASYSQRKNSDIVILTGLEFACRRISHSHCALSTASRRKHTLALNTRFRHYLTDACGPRPVSPRSAGSPFRGAATLACGARWGTSKGVIPRSAARFLLTAASWRNDRGPQRAPGLRPLGCRRGICFCVVFSGNVRSELLRPQYHQLMRSRRRRRHLEPLRRAAGRCQPRNVAAHRRHRL